MQFSDTTNSNGIVQYVNFLVQTNTTKYPLVDIARNANTWYRRVVGWIWKASGDWTFDDINATTLPVATTTLVDNQRDYSLPVANGTEYGEIERVEVKKSDGNYYRLTRIERNDITTAMTEFYKTKGLPVHYYLHSNSLLLLPAADTTMTTAAAGLKIYLSRDVDEFVGTDTAQEPGFHRNWHPVLAYGAALEYALAYGMNEKVPYLRGEIERIEKEVLDYYSRRVTKDAYQDSRMVKQNYR